MDMLIILILVKIPQYIQGYQTITLYIFVVQSLSRVHLFNPMDYSTPDFPVHHQLLEFTQTHVHQVSDAIQPSHPLSSPSPPALSLSQHQGLFPVSRLFTSGYWVQSNIV